MKKHLSSSSHFASREFQRIILALEEISCVEKIYKSTRNMIRLILKFLDGQSVLTEDIILGELGGRKEGRLLLFTDEKKLLLTM